jgi:Cytochrome c554 and c-prime
VAKFKKISIPAITAVLFMVWPTLSRCGANPDRNDYVGNEVCERCHASIYQSYASTPMARASGPAKQNFIPADFVHSKSGIHYRIYVEDNRVWLSFERPGDPSVRGKRELLYYIGSGQRGMKYLFALDGFLFESPIDWYAKAAMWDMTPNYQNAREMPLNLPAYTSCLRCHVSGMQAPLAGTVNRYQMPVFAFSGISCERCHGPGAAHVSGGAIVNPGKLAADRRDAICMECHLEGKVGIERRGRHAYEFRPGERLSDYVRHYLLVGGSTQTLGAVSQVEALAQSVCKKKTGDGMSCMSCHDPHYSPVGQRERISYFRGKCLTCHGAAFASKHHADQPDCTACHMPSTLSTDVAHTQVTDHRIPRRPILSPELDTTDSALRLVPFPYSEEAQRDARDLGLAWEALAEMGIENADKEARYLLRSAMAQTPDPLVLSAFGYLEQRAGAIDQAREAYEKALALDPNMIDAATNLGVIEANSGHWSNAVKLWKGAFERAPGKSGLGMNIARAFCSMHEFEEARTYVLRVLEFDPDSENAKRFLRQLNRTPPACPE